MNRFDMQELYEKSGGIFRFTVLVQKRLKQLNSGQKPLVKCESKNQKEIVFKEILEGKIQLIDNDELLTNPEIEEKENDLLGGDTELPSLKK